MKARAIENLSYVVGVNRIGKDEKDNEYTGHTAVYDPLGLCISGGPSTVESLVTAELDYLELQALAEAVAFLEDRDNFDLY